MQRDIRESAELLAEMLEDDPDYKQFIAISEKLEANPELAERVHAFRKRNFELQNSSADPAREMQELSREYQSLCRNPLAEAYFEAESGVCRTLQEILHYIGSQIRVPKI